MAEEQGITSTHDGDVMLYRVRHDGTTTIHTCDECVTPLEVVRMYELAIRQIKQAFPEEFSDEPDVPTVVINRSYMPEPDGIFVTDDGLSDDELRELLLTIISPSPDREERIEAAIQKRKVFEATTPPGWRPTLGGYDGDIEEPK